MAVSMERAQALVARVHSALVAIEGGARDDGTRSRLRRLHHMLGAEALPMLAEHFEVPVTTFSGGEPKPPPPPGG